MKERTSNPQVQKASKFRVLPTLKLWTHTTTFKILLLLVVAGFIGVTGFVIYHYEQDSRTIDRFLGGAVFQQTARVYARPYHLYPGQKLRPESVVARLQRAGYEPSGTKTAENGFYQMATNKITLEPSVGEPIRLEFDKTTLTMMDTDKDGRVRAPELLEAVKWAGGLLNNPDDLWRIIPLISGVSFEQAVSTRSSLRLEPT